jgi:hypothetical protein
MRCRLLSTDPGSTVKCTCPSSSTATTRTTAWAWQLPATSITPGRIRAGQPRCRKCHRWYDGAVGVGNPQAKLSDDSVRKLRSRRADGLTYRQLATEFGISDVSAYAAVHRKTWAHVT